MGFGLFMSRALEIVTGCSVVFKSGFWILFQISSLLIREATLNKTM